jgi:hypothetical protein
MLPSEVGLSEVHNREAIDKESLFNVRWRAAFWRSRQWPPFAMTPIIEHQHVALVGESPCRRAGQLLIAASDNEQLAKHFSISLAPSVPGRWARLSEGLIEQRVYERPRLGRFAVTYFALRRDGVLDSFCHWLDTRAAEGTQWAPLKDHLRQDNRLVR